MMTVELDHGIRCEEHVGEVFPPRCRECDAAAQGGLSQAETPDRKKGVHTVETLGGTIHGHCVEHPEYPSCERWPCAKCIREQGPVSA